jgi:hypothetical protein
MLPGLLPATSEAGIFLRPANAVSNSLRIAVLTARFCTPLDDVGVALDVAVSDLADAEAPGVVGWPLVAETEIGVELLLHPIAAVAISKHIATALPGGTRSACISASIVDGTQVRPPRRRYAPLGCFVDLKALLHGPTIGEVARRLTSAEEPVQLFHYRDRDQVEVDMVHSTCLGL